MTPDNEPEIHFATNRGDALCFMVDEPIVNDWDKITCDVCVKISEEENDEQPI